MKAKRNKITIRQEWIPWIAVASIIIIVYIFAILVG